MQKSDVFVYIAGKYTAPTEIEIDQNILDAKIIAVKLAQSRVNFFCPHTHTANFGRYTAAPWQYYMNGCMHILSKACNCVLMVDNWRTSTGAMEEHAFAEKHGYPIFYSIEAFFEWHDSLG